MPEGDTIWRTANRLSQALSGRPLTVSDLRWASLATADLRGATTLEVASRGKHILQRLDSGLTLHSHLRMEGQWRIAATPELTKGTLRNHDLRAVLSTEKWTALGLRLGMLDLVPTAHESELVGHLGPDLLGDDWDQAKAVARVIASRQPIGAAMLDQRNLAGIETIWAAEGLFIERLHPWTPADELEPDAVAALVHRIHTLMTSARQSGTQSTTGIRRRGENFYVHGRSGRPCRRCGGTVRVAAIGAQLRERPMFYCSACQGVTHTERSKPEVSGPRARETSGLERSVEKSE